MNDQDERVSGVFFDWRNPHSASRLARAVRSKNVKDVKRLISRGVALDSPDNRGFTPLHEAAKDDDCTQIARILLKAGAYVDHKTVEDETPLYIACANSSENMVKLLIAHKCCINACNVDGFTPLHVACAKKNLDIIRCLISAGADLNVKDIASQKTPIFVAVENSNAEAVKILLKAGANTNLNDYYNRTLLQFACAVDDIEVFDILLNHFGTTEKIINYQSEDGWTLLMEAVQFKNFKVIERLINYGVDMSLTDNRGLLALHIAAHCDNLKCLELIINNTPMETIEKCSTNRPDMTHTRSLPCLLLDRNMYEGLELLLNYGLSKEVISCPVKMGSHLASPISFLLLHASNIDNKDKLKYLDLMLTKEELIDPKYETKYEVVSTLDASVKMHHPSHVDCICLEALSKILKKNAIPDDISEDLSRSEDDTNLIPELFRSLIEMGYIEGLKLTLRYTTVIEPEDLMVNFFIKIFTGSMKGSYRWLGNEIALAEFFLGVCNNTTPVCKTFSDLLAQNCYDYYPNVWAISELIKHRKVPSLKVITRSEIRRDLHRLCLPGEFLNKLRSLDVPKLIIKFLTYEDL
ncbi:ankyrin-3-like [Cimex lectularius]|uniref:Uncharacterized protein n=1 Tax=Cimex lectularius TaxID=79782 RepID=A0A8I6RVB5_CIMLE|nr:ankyrin-3-like [Cimex lectularius]